MNRIDVWEQQLDQINTKLETGEVTLKKGHRIKYINPGGHELTIPLGRVQTENLELEQAILQDCINSWKL